MAQWGYQTPTVTMGGKKQVLILRDGVIVALGTPTDPERAHAQGQRVVNFMRRVQSIAKHKQDLHAQAQADKKTV